MGKMLTHENLNRSSFLLQFKPAMLQCQHKRLLVRLVLSGQSEIINHDFRKDTAEAMASFTLL